MEYRSRTGLAAAHERESSSEPIDRNLIDGPARLREVHGRIEARSIVLVA
jgi:hypothetical protein